MADNERNTLDGWENADTALGVLGKDKRLSAEFSGYSLSQTEAEALWRSDDMFARIVETIPNEMMRVGWALKIPDNKELADDISTVFKDLGASEVILSALYHARALPGAAILVGARDGVLDLSLPLREDNIREITHLSIFTPDELQVKEWYTDPLEPKFGQPKVYWLNPTGVPASGVGMRSVHESRLIRISGVKTTRANSINGVIAGWDDSVLSRVYEIVRDFQTSFDSASLLIQDFAVGTLKIKGLANVLKSKEVAAGQGLADRAAAFNLGRSVARIAILDSEEEFKRESTNVTGLGEMLDKLMLRLASAAGMPLSLLMGQSPGGLNATGESEIRWFYDTISAQRERVLRPVLERLYRLIMLSKVGPTRGKEPESWEIEFEPLWQMTPKEQAELRKLHADTDAAYINAGVLLPEEVANSRFGGDEYGSEIVLDEELRAAYEESKEEAPDAEDPTETQAETATAEDA